MSSPFLKTPWFHITERSIQSCPVALRSYLTEPDSLTLYLQKNCSGSINLELNQQRWKQPLLEESQLLNIAQDRYALTREIQIFCEDNPLMFARSIIPRSTYEKRQHHFSRLGLRPLANLLFSDPHIFRQELQIAKITSQSMLAQSASILKSTLSSETGSEPCLWARRSIFYIAKHPLLVTEVFLPGINSCLP